MKLKAFIKRLQKLEEKNGNLDVTIYCDQEYHPEGLSSDSVVNTIVWVNEKNKPKELMLCDRFVFRELRDQVGDD